MLNKLINVIKWYLSIGLIVAASAVLMGEDGITIESVEVAAIIIVLWPIWVFLRVVFA
jgi:hypothetical protein